jgi:non-homologous end joining protein Ku
MEGPSETRRDAVAKVAMHNREHVVLIRPAEGGLILHTLYYGDELHKANKSQSPKTKFTSKETRYGQEPACKNVRTAKKTARKRKAARHGWPALSRTNSKPVAPLPDS